MTVKNPVSGEAGLGPGVLNLAAASLTHEQLMQEFEKWEKESAEREATLTAVMEEVREILQGAPHG